MTTSPVDGRQTARGIGKEEGMRSLFRRLHRRFGRRQSGADRARRAEAHRARILGFLPLNLASHAVPARRGESVRVAVVGGGFAGLCAARALQNLQATVTLFEARSQLGGRVESTSGFLAGRILEKGAELIGSNHPLWLQLAREFGLGLTVLTEEDEFSGAGLAVPVRLRGRRLTPAQVERLYQGMKRAQDDLVRRAAAVTDPFNPWLTPGAGALDATSLQSWIHGFTSDPLLRAALELEYANDNVVSTAQQSLLAVLAQIAGGGGEAFWEDTEVYRCADGNAALATALATRIATTRPAGAIHLGEIVHDVDIVANEVVVTSGRPGASRRTTRHDYAVLALPPSVWSALTMRGRPIPLPRIQTGPAVKYLAETRKRFWIAHDDAPSGVSDELGQVWEGTDNQMGGGSIVLSTFAGGPWASAIRPRPPDRYLDPLLDALLPGFRGRDGKVRATFADWPAESFIRTGYCCPAPRQVTTLQLWMQQAIGGRVFFAGEHTSPPFFGFMEGALHSGLAAAGRIALAAGIALPSAVGVLTGSGVRPRIPRQVP